MPTANAVAGSVGTCYAILQRVREDLEDLQYYDLAEDIKNATYILYRIKKQHDAAIEALERSHAVLGIDIEKAQRNELEERQRVGRRDETIREQSKEIERLKREIQTHRDNEKIAYQRGFDVGHDTLGNRIKWRDDAIAAQNQKLGAQAAEIEKLKEEVSQAKAVENMVWQRGFAAGKGSPNKSRTADPSPMHEPPISTPTRERWLRQLQLTNSHGYTLSSGLKGAILLGNKEIVATIIEMERPWVVAPALHMAALFGDVEIVKLLIRHGADVNEVCAAKSETGGHLYGVTPMHLAVGAQHHAMIRLLYNGGASFRAVRFVPEGKKACAAPPMWLVSKRWLALTGKTNPQSVVGTLRTMKSLGWNPRASVNQEGETVRSLVGKNLKEWRELQRSVLDFLDGRVL